MPSSYPGGLDSFSTSRADATVMLATHAADHNNYADAINKLEAEIGINFSGKTLPVFNVKGKTYNAVGDGVADDRAAIQAAIDAANSAAGGIVFLPKGTYKVTTTPLILKSNVSVIGVGHSSVIKGSIDTGHGLITMGTPGVYSTSKTLNTRVVLKDFKIHADASGSHGCHLRNTSYLIIDNVEVEGYGITGLIRQSLWFEHCDFVHIKAPTVHDSNGNGVQVNGCDHVTLEAPIVDNVRDDAIDIDYDFLHTSTVKSRWVTVSGHVIDGVTAGNGIRVENSDYVAIGAGSVRDTVNAGIRINSANSVSCRYISVTGQVISDCLVYGIDVQYESGTQDVQKVTLAGNTIVNCGNTGTGTGGGIAFRGTSGDHVAEGNNVSSCGNSGAGDRGGVLFWKSNNILYSGGSITDCTNMAVNAWNGDALTTITSVVVQGVKLRNNTADFGGGGQNQTGFKVRNITTDASSSVASAATITLPTAHDFVTVTGTTTITSVTASYAGRQVTLAFSGALTFTDGSNLKLAGNFVTTADDTISLVSDGTNWLELARSVN
jgi:hypothetical protein